MVPASSVIAVLDDEPRMRLALSRLIRIHGFKVAPFADGETFLAAAAEGSFDCVLLDLHMPGLDGFAVLEALAAGGKRPRAIVITGNDAPGNAERVAQLGAEVYLLKPVDESLLIEAIARTLGITIPPAD